MPGDLGAANEIAVWLIWLAALLFLPVLLDEIAKRGKGWRAVFAVIVGSVVAGQLIQESIEFASPVQRFLIYDIGLSPRVSRPIVLSLVFGLPPCVTTISVYGLLAWRHGKHRPAIAEARRRQGLCTGCGYDLTGNESGTCPECGLPIGKAASHRP